MKNELKRAHVASLKSICCACGNAGVLSYVKETRQVVSAGFRLDNNELSCEKCGVTGAFERVAADS